MPIKATKRYVKQKRTEIILVTILCADLVGSVTDNLEVNKKNKEKLKQTSEVWAWN